MKASFESYLRSEIENNWGERYHYVSSAFEYSALAGKYSTARMATPADTAKALIDHIEAHLINERDGMLDELVGLEIDLVNIQADLLFVRR